MFKYLKNADLRKFDCIGFDLDHTFAKYKNEGLFRLAYQVLSHRVADTIPNLSSAAKDYLKEPVTSQRALDIVNCKGWVYDSQRFCYVWLEVKDDSNAIVKRLARGLEPSSITDCPDEISKTYENTRFSMIKRLLMPRQIENGWHPNKAAGHHVIENNFEFGYLALHLKLLELYNTQQLQAGNPEELRTHCSNAIAFAFTDPSPYFEQFKQNTEEYLSSSVKLAEELKTLGTAVF